MTDAQRDPDVSIVIVSYQTRDMTLACIRSVIEQTSTTSYEIIVLDNASTDGSADAIRSQFPTLTLIASDENLGFARANNVAAARARGRRLLLLNPDTVVLDQAIDRLQAFASKHPDHGIWGGRTVFGDGTLNPASCWRRATLWSVFCRTFGLTQFRNSPLFNWEGYGGWGRDTEREVDIVTGCFFLVERGLWDRCHGFDPVFFMYGEEADLCLRARHLFGARPMITPDATIIHYGHASEPHAVEQKIKVFAGRVSLMQRHQTALSVQACQMLYMATVLSRMVLFGTAAVMTGQPKMQRSAQVWFQIWRARERWINGWTDAAANVARDVSSIAPAAAAHAARS
jgi:GT2 family glycosyltransferase